MTWNLDSWKTTFAECLPEWRQRMQQAGITSVYSFVSAMALWPVAAAAQAGHWEALAALGSIVATVGSNVVAGRLQYWKDETDAAKQLTAALEIDKPLQAELAMVLGKLNALTQARAVLPETDRYWFDEALQREGSRLGNAIQYTAWLEGAGAMAQGSAATAAGQGSVIIGGSVHGNVNSSSHGELAPLNDCI